MIEKLQFAFKKAFKELSIFSQIRNPVMFVTYIGALLSTIYLLFLSPKPFSFGFEFQLTLWLWLTIFFANFAESYIEAIGETQTEHFRKAQYTEFARLMVNGKEVKVPVHSLKKGDLIYCQVGDTIPVDGEVVEGVATVDESAITGESAPVIRESGSDKNTVTAGTNILSDHLLIQVTAGRGLTFLERIIQTLEGAKKQKTPNETALNVLLSTWTIIFTVVIIALKFYADYFNDFSQKNQTPLLTLPTLIAFLVCLIPTLIAALLNSIGIAGVNRLLFRNVVANSEFAVETAGDIDLLILDKAGTITVGNREATQFLPVDEVSEQELAEIAQIASLADETPEGRSIVVLAKELYRLRGEVSDSLFVKYIPFTAKTGLSGVDFLDAEGNITRSIRKGAESSIINQIKNLGGTYSEQVSALVKKVTASGGIPLIVSNHEKIVGIVVLKDKIKGGIKEKLFEIRKMGIQTFMMTRDSQAAAAAVAAETGVDDYMGDATPDKKLEFIKQEQGRGKLIAMTGGGKNDAPALAQADVAVAMNAADLASREAGNMVDLDNNPAKLIEIVEIGKQQFMTRGALTHFSIASNIPKYFILMAALFGNLFSHEQGKEGPLTILNFMHLNSPQTAILSTVIYNAIIILCWIPIVLRGIYYKPQAADRLLLQNFLIYGLGGFILPLIIIKCLDSFLFFTHLVS